MFTDGRSKKVIFLAHCLLNQNAISDGTAVCPAAFGELIQLPLDHEVGVVQMPCPELCCLGLDRGDVHGADRPVVEENTRIRRAMEKDGPRQNREALAGLVSEQVQEYRRHGFQVLGIVTAGWRPPRILTGRWRAGALLWRPSPSGWRRRGSPPPCWG